MGRAEEIVARLVRDGEAEVIRLIDDHASEDLFLEFKQSADDGAGVKLHQNDWKNLARAISGFGNSEGGVVLWGIACKSSPAGDVPQGPKAIQNPTRFVSWLEGAVSGCTVPAHSGVRSIPIKSTVTPGSGFVATLIPRSHATPLQCIKPPGTLEFLMRAGSNFMPVPHAVLSGMFGRGPQPEVRFKFLPKCAEEAGIEASQLKLNFRLDFTLTSSGPGVCRDVYLTCSFELPEPSCGASFDTSASLFEGDSVGNRISLIAPDWFRLAPDAPVTPLVLNIWFTQPLSSAELFKGTFRLSVVYGHSASPVGRFDLFQEANQFQTRFTQLRGALIALKAGAGASPNHVEALVNRLFSQLP